MRSLFWLLFIALLMASGLAIVAVYYFSVIFGYWGWVYLAVATFMYSLVKRNLE